MENLESFLSTTFWIYFVILPFLGGLVFRISLNRHWWIGVFILFASMILAHFSLLQTSLSLEQRIGFVVMLAISGGAVADFFKFIMPRPAALLWVAEVVAVFLLLQYIGYLTPLKIFWQLYN